MESLLDILSLKSLFKPSDLNEIVAEYVVGVPESKLSKQWKKGDSSRSELKKDLGLPEMSSYDDVLRANEPDKYGKFEKGTRRTQRSLDILHYAVLNIEPDYDEDMCFHGKDICVIANSLDLARVMACLSDDSLYSQVISRGHHITDFIRTIKYKPPTRIRAGKVEPILETVSIPTEEDMKTCLTVSKLYKILLQKINARRQGL